MTTLQPTLQYAVLRPGLPLELMDRIVDTLSNDVPSLTACALSSRQLVHRSRYHLFRAIHFDFIPHRSFNRCENFLEKCQNAAPLVRSLTLSENALQASEPQLPTIFAMMKNLTSLHLVKVDLVGINIILAPSSAGSTN
ncbi:uncharacterized protein BT62DRAFT_938329 [Guyanagaster necrorhizus]|uniref:F-box domain-containing protein n=1 Tax=Guyanagaster necrorhizus TaxID=856835 RepID=A0A9P8ALF2_9AGAR|nr:uncharacterized protein BT62DRAFT_938329 [Guyanagaster necrorhizus MCA 3950]KAG7440133.1 hypothetical protein BT62DRAFT_938329 [Guyanagaster necrorhizus MCA 3950]